MITFIVASSAVKVIYCCIWFEQKSQLRGTFMEGGGGDLKFFETSMRTVNIKKLKLLKKSSTKHAKHEYE